MTVERQTALHIAAEKNKFEAFKAMLEWIQSAFEDNQSMRSKILNLQDKDGNTALHLAASINQPRVTLSTPHNFRPFVSQRGLN